MPLLATEAIVLHAFDYLESSRIIRLLTREAGVQSALARGARKSRARYGSALDLFAEGSAQLYVKPNRELHNLAAFEVARSRSELAEEVDRLGHPKRAEHVADDRAAPAPEIALGDDGVGDVAAAATADQDFRAERPRAVDDRDCAG